MVVHHMPPSLPPRSLVAIYPLVSNMTSQRWADGYTLEVDQVGVGGVAQQVVK